MKYFKNNILKIGIAIFMMSFIIWNRILRERSPQIFSKLENKNALLVISFFCCCAFLFLLLRELDKFVKRPQQSKNLLEKLMQHHAVQNIVTILKNYTVNTPIHAYETLTGNLSLAKYLELPASYFTAYFCYPKLFVWMFYLFPQILVAIIFCIETIYLNQKIFFFKALILLVIPLLAKAVIYIFESYSTRRLKSYEEFLDITYEAEGVYINLKPPALLPQNIPLELIVNKYNLLYQYWYIYKEINTFMQSIKRYNEKTEPYVRMFIFMCFFSGWFYLLIYLLKEVF